MANTPDEFLKAVKDALVVRQVGTKLVIGVEIDNPNQPTLMQPRISPTQSDEFIRIKKERDWLFMGFMLLVNVVVAVYFYYSK